MINVPDDDIVFTEFKFQSYNYVYFQKNTVRKGMNFLISSFMALIIRILFFYYNCFGIL